MNDHIVKVAFVLDALDQCALFGAVGGLGGLAAVHVLTDGLRVEVVTSASVSLGLSGIL